jgi:hypothetical protein
MAACAEALLGQTVLLRASPIQNAILKSYIDKIAL